MQLTSFTSSLALLAASAVSVNAAWVAESTEITDGLYDDSLATLQKVLADGSFKKHLATKNVDQDCDINNAAVRKEYTLLTNEEKLEYTAAVQCLMTLPSIIPDEIVPGAKSYYDDFVATHANLTLVIHQTGNFLAWHRYFISTFETALRDQCGYSGYLPYWNWAKSAQDPVNSPYFDGSIYSQGGNGAKVNHTCYSVGDNIPCIEPELGGGCVTGPYADYKANLTSPSPTFPNTTAGEMFGYDPRCMRRDISQYVTSTYSTEDKIEFLLTNEAFQSEHIAGFQNHLQGYPGNWTVLDLHGAGHFTYGGDPAGDFYISPNDPMFWLHHGMVDRTWATWQNQDPIPRAFSVNGTRTMLNDPVSDDATIDDDLPMGYLAPEDPQRNHISTVGGGYCYIYQ